MIQIFRLFGSLFFEFLVQDKAISSHFRVLDPLTCLVCRYTCGWPRGNCRLYFALKYLTGGRKATRLMHPRKRLLAHINIFQDQPILGSMGNGTRLMLKPRKCLICIWSSRRLVEFWWFFIDAKRRQQLWINGSWLTSSRASYAYQSFLVASRPMSDLLGLLRLTPLRHCINLEEGGCIQSTTCLWIAVTGLNSQWHGDTGPRVKLEILSKAAFLKLLAGRNVSLLGTELCQGEESSNMPCVALAKGRMSRHRVYKCVDFWGLWRNLLKRRAEIWVRLGDFMGCRVLKIMTGMIVMTHILLFFHGMGTFVKIRSLLDSLGPSSWWMSLEIVDCFLFSKFFIGFLWQLLNLQEWCREPIFVNISSPLCLAP